MDEFYWNGRCPCGRKALVCELTEKKEWGVSGRSAAARRWTCPDCGRWYWAGIYNEQRDLTKDIILMEPKVEEVIELAAKGASP